jgi:hypothetical protein
MEFLETLVIPIAAMYADLVERREETWRERGPYGPYIHSTGDKRTNELGEQTNELNTRQTNDMTKAGGFLTMPKKHLELQKTSRTPTIVLSCVRVHLDAHRTF